jgi:hypothetical protein
MSDSQTTERIQQMLAGLEQGKVQMEGLELEDLRRVMEHPGARKFIAEWMPHEASSVKPGESAPDFTLPYLPGQGREPGETATLSDHFGNRPVALVFGSYT